MERGAAGPAASAPRRRLPPWRYAGAAVTYRPEMAGQPGICEDIKQLVAAARGSGTTRVPLQLPAGHYAFYLESSYLGWRIIVTEWR
jgi:hypothetical protein